MTWLRAVNRQNFDEWRGGGGGRGVEREARFLRWWNWERLRKVLQHFVIFCPRNGQRGKNHYENGKEPEVKGTGNVRFKHPLPTPPSLISGRFCKKLLFRRQSEGNRVT